MSIPWLGVALMNNERPLTWVDLRNLETKEHMEEEPKKFEVKDNTGTIWLEVQKKDGNQGPYEVRTGDGKIFGKDVWINAYEKETKTGKKLLSLTFKEKPQRGGQDNSVSALGF